MSEIGIIEKSTAQAICNAIKAKEGSTEPIPFNTVAERITAISSGSNKLAQVVDGTLTELTADDLAGVTKIRESAFYKSPQLKSVTIPDSATSIEVGAFNSCLNLEEIKIGSGVTVIKQSAFMQCKKLINIIIPNNVTTIEQNFVADGNMKVVRIGNGITSLSSYTFGRCSTITDIYIDKPEGSITGAPWGASNSPTIHWNTPLPTEE